MERDGHRRITGYTPESEWDQTERDWMLALDDYEHSLCPRCGMPVSVCHDELTPTRYTAEAGVCQISLMRDIAAEDWRKQHDGEAGIKTMSLTTAIEAPDLAVAYQSAPGMAGSHDVTLDDPLGCAYPGLRRIALGVVTVGEDDEMMDARRRLGSLIGRLATLSYRELPGQWRGRVTIKDWDERMLGPCRVDCATTIMMDAYPHIMGRAQRHTLKEGANLLHVTGNRPAWPVLTLTTSRAVSALSIRDGRGHTIGIRPAATLPAGTSVLVDCKAQTTRANGTLAPVSLDTDYFALLPGMNTLTLSGAAGSCEHEPEWMI